MSIILVFPPSWTSATGSPHLAVPLLAAFLRGRGIETYVRDANWEIVNSLGVRFSADSARRACDGSTMDELNRPYFVAEDKLDAIAAQFQGRWNAQVGFEYNGLPHTYSASALHSLETPSPFDDYFKTVLVPDIVKRNPLVLGICVACVQQIIPTLQMCHQLRSAGFEGFIVLGGNTISRLVDRMGLSAIFDLIDGLVTFQGELPLLRIYEALKAKKSLEGVPQLTYRTSAGDIRINPIIATLNVDEAPTPDYRGLPIGRYWGENYLNLVAARGCYYGKCTFCAIPYGWGPGGFAGSRHVKNVFTDIATCMELYGVRRFKFVDEALSPAFLTALADTIIAERIDIEWEGYVRCESAWCDRAFVKHLAMAGFRKGYFGLELVPSGGRMGLNKADSPAPERLTATCGDFGIKVHLFCMFGFPGTDEDDARRTIKFLVNFQNVIDTADIFPWVYARHTEVREVIPIESPAHDWALELSHRPGRPGTFSSDEVAQLARKYEDMIWDAVPRLLHPTYRLISPWTSKTLPGG
jgi:hypothetical protein